MKRIALALAAVMLSWGAAFAQDVPKLIGPVNDYANVLTAQQNKDISKRLMDIMTRRNDRAQIVILTTKSTGDSIEEYASKVFHAWALGQKGRDNGVLLIVAPTERKMRLEVGYGVEPYLTDGKARSITADMRPFLGKNDYAGAFNGAITSIAANLGPDADKPVANIVVNQVAAKKEEGSSHIMLWLILLAIAGGGIWWLFFRDKPKKVEPRNSDTPRPPQPAPVTPTAPASPVVDTPVQYSHHDSYIAPMATGALAGAATGGMVATAMHAAHERQMQQALDEAEYEAERQRQLARAARRRAAEAEDEARAERQRRQDEEDRRARQRRADDEEEERKRRKKRDDDSSSSWSSWSSGSSDSSSSSSSSGSDWSSSSGSDSSYSGGGGDSGGGGSSDSW